MKKYLWIKPLNCTKQTLIILKRLIGFINYAVKTLRLKLLPQSLLYRFVLIILLPLIFLQTLIFIFFYDRHWDIVSKRLAADVVGEVQTVADIILLRLPEEETQKLLHIAQHNFTLQFTFQEGAYLTEQNVFVSTQTSALISALLGLKYPVNMKEFADNRQAISIQLPTGVLHTIIPKKRFFTSTVHVFLIWMIGSSALLFWIAFLFMKNQIRSIEKLAQASELFGLGQDMPFKPSGATEVRRAGFAFILMKNRIQKYLSERTGMLSAVSHDLRTPLTRMKLQISMLPDIDTQEDLNADVVDMEKMLNGYLAFARGEGKEEARLILLNELVDELVTKQERVGQKITLHNEGDLPVYARVNDLSRAITNILTNADRYAKKATIRTGNRENYATVIIDDDGPGIPQEKRDEVFKAFYRLEPSRNPKTGGVGLGMTITRDIILSHGGDITLGESPFGGLRVVIRLPLQEKYK